IPAATVQRGPQGTFIYAVGEDSTAVLKPVTVGVITGDLAIIEKGLSPNEKVVVEGQNQLRPGAKVAPRPTAAKSAEVPPPGVAPAAKLPEAKAPEAPGAVPTGKP